MISPVELLPNLDNYGEQEPFNINQCLRLGNLAVPHYYTASGYEGAAQYSGMETDSASLDNRALAGLVYGQIHPALLGKHRDPKDPNTAQQDAEEWDEGARRAQDELRRRRLQEEADRQDQEGK